MKNAAPRPGNGRGNLRLRRPLNPRHLPEPAMKPLTIFIAIAALAAVATPADAKGCLKGAMVGGVAGHYAGHHGVLGAIAGCAYGRHRAKEQARTRQAPAGQERL